MKAKFLLLVLFSLCYAVMKAQPDSLALVLSQRVKHLEGEKDIRDGKFQVLSDQLKTDFNALKAEADRRSMTTWLVIGGAAAFLGISLLGILKFAKNHAQTLVQEKLDKELPPMVQQQMEQSFKKLLQQHAQTVLDLVGKHDRIEGFKRDKKILILAEDEKDGAKMEGIVKGMGFKNVAPRIADTFENTEKHDLVIIARENDDSTHYKKLTGQAIWDFLANQPKNRVVLYYGPRFERLDAAVREKIQFSNIVFTTYARIIEVFEYQHLLELQTKSKIS